MNLIIECDMGVMEKTIKISGGQKQRVKQPKLVCRSRCLILDEIQKLLDIRSETKFNFYS